MTAAFFGIIEQAVAIPKQANDCCGVWHDVLHMSRACPLRVWQGGRLLFTSRPDGHPLRSPLCSAPGPAAGPQAISALTRLFRVIITGTGRKRLHTLKAISHPDETGLPCLTIMLPDED